MTSLSYPKKIFIQGPGQPPYIAMFAKRGFKAALTIEEADLICFTGGEDVDPQLYGEKALPNTYFNPNRDRRDILAYEAARDKFKVGICRGGQFLNVMNGGKMWQDVDNHCRTHVAKDLTTSKEFYVTSTHHQMMRPSDKGVVVCVADESYVKTSAEVTEKVEDADFEDDIEVVWYPETKSLCFQPHPEFAGAQPTENYFFDLLLRYYR